MLSRGAMTREDIRVLTDDEIECFNDCSYDIFIDKISRVFDYFDANTMELISEIEDLKQKLNNLQADYDDFIEQTV